MEFGDFLDNDEGSDGELKWDYEDDSSASDSSDDDDYDDSSQIQKKRKLKDDNKKERKKMRGERKVAPPTAEEMIHLRETETLFKSNLFRLEIEEMLKQIKPLKSLQNEVQTWIAAFKKSLNKIKESTDWLHVSDTDWLNEIDVCLPLPDLGKIYDGLYKMMRPVDVKAVGSYYCDCTIGPKFNVDIALIIPRVFFRKKDYLNQTYHYKRALYLCGIVGCLKKSNLLGEKCELKFRCMNGDSLKPVVEVEVCGGKVKMMIHAVPEEGTFVLNRFVPTKNNIRHSWWASSHTTHQQELCGTPLYNSSILEDVVMESNEKLRKQMFDENENMKDALSLLRVWLKQRHLDQGYGGFSCYIMSMVLVYLKQKHKINKHMSSYQVIRIVWIYLSESDWCDEGASMYRGEVAPVSVSDFHSYFDVVFIEPSGYLNLAARISKLTYLKVKSESGYAIELLDTTEVNGFQALFMIKIPFFQQYDHYISFSSEELVKRVVSEHGSSDKDMDHNGDAIPMFEKLVTDLLARALGERITQISTKLNECVEWPVSSPRPHALPDVILIAMKLHPQNAFNIIDKGPQANLPEAEEFREFWGKKSELRRFKDSTVCECTVWEQESPSLSRRFIINKHITAFVLNKLGIKPSDYIYVAHQLDHIIQTRPFNVSAEEACVKIHQSLEELSRQLVELEDLPLQVTTVHCISPCYRYADVFPPLASYKPNHPPLWTYSKGGCLLIDDILKAPPFYPAIDLVVQMTISGKWPEELAACKRLTAAFYIAIANKLLFKHKLKYIVHTDYLLVQKDGLMFRLMLGYSKAISLVKMNITKDGVKSYKDTPESLELEKKFINLPDISGALHGLSVVEAGFGGGVRLVKRWLTAHMLDSSHFPGVVAELLVASLFLRPHPFQPLLQPQQVFLRFLHIMASTNWYTDLMVVNFNNILTKDEIMDIESKFEKERSSFPAVVIVTPYDKSGTLWTRKVPTLPTIVRLAKLASASLEILQVQLQTTIPKDNFTSVFKPCLELYDLVISLKESMVPRLSERVTFTQPNNKINVDNLSCVTLPVTDFDPPQLYLKYLRENYDEFALFFYDPHGGSDIGVLFKPNTYQSSEFKVNGVGGKRPCYDEEPPCLRTNFKSIISDFKELGRGLIQKITLSKRFKNTLANQYNLET